MGTWTELKNKIKTYRKATGKGAISVDDVFATMQEIIEKCEAIDLSGGLSTRKTYTSYALMVADQSPIDTYTGRLLRHGQLVAVGNTSDTTKNGIYRYVVTGWEYLRDVGDITSKCDADIFEALALRYQIRYISSFAALDDILEVGIYVTIWAGHSWILEVVSRPDMIWQRIKTPLILDSSGNLIMSSNSEVNIFTRSKKTSTPTWSAWK